MIVNTPPPFGCPEVSVIIPMYNAEKYIAECLESLLAQTFRNFEVVIVDDCSTDSSCAVVESLAERFGGRLNLYHMEKNSGSGALPRNKGLILSRGEYVFFADADDMLTETALEELYTLAKDFDADVVYCDRYFSTDEDGTNPRERSDQADFPLVDKPTLETQDFNQRVQNLVSLGYWVVAWTKLVRRSLLLENEIFFPNILPADDNVWTYELVFHAKRFLRVPNIVYFYRDSEISIMRTDRSAQQQINFQFKPLMCALDVLNEQLGKLEFFRQNPSQLYGILEFMFHSLFYPIFEAGFELENFEIYDTLKQKFGDELGDHDILIFMLSVQFNKIQKEFALKRRDFAQFAAAAQNRIAELEAELERLKS